MIGGDREEKQRKKIQRLIRTSVWGLGLGIGLLIARFIAPLIMGESEIANRGFSGFGWALVGYGAIQLAVLTSMRQHALKICSVITYIIMPVILLKLLMGIM